MPTSASQRMINKPFQPVHKTTHKRKEKVPEDVRRGPCGALKKNKKKCREDTYQALVFDIETR